MRRRSVLLAAPLLAMSALPLAAPAVAAEPDVLCELSDDRLTEISGMALSRQHPDVVWMHNDSSGGPLLFAVSLKDCSTIATIRISGSAARDYEGMAIGTNRSGRDVIWLGDIGDNRDSWPYVEVVRIREPRVLRDRTVSGTAFHFTYEDGPHNAEALLAHGTQLWVVSKQLASGSVYRLPDPLQRGAVNVAARIGEAEGLVTDGAVTADGARYALRDYWTAWVFDGLPMGEPAQEVPLPPQEQGEAMTWTADGSALIIASEGDRRLLRVLVAGDAGAAGPATTAPAPEESSAPDAEGGSADTRETVLFAPIVLALLAALAVIAVAEVRRRRS